MVNRQSELIQELIVENEKLKQENEFILHQWKIEDEVCCGMFAKYIQIMVVMGIALIVSIAYNIWG